MKRACWLRSAASGGAAGFLNGFFGGGGGLVLVPLFVHFCKLDRRRAFASSIAVIFPLCVVSAGVYFLRGRLDFAVALPFLLGGLTGGALGGLFFRHIRIDWLRRGFGLLILYGGIRALAG